MSAEIVIYTLLGNSADIKAVVADRIYLNTRPEADALPAIVYSMVSEKQDNAIIGSQERVTARMQVTCLGNVADDLVSLRDLVRKACHNQSGTIGGVTVNYCLQDAVGPDHYDELVDVYTKHIDFKVHYLR